MNKIEDINILEKVNFKELRPLNLNDNKISDIKVFERVNFKNLEIIYIKDNNIDVNEFPKIIDVLKSKLKVFYY